MSIRCMVLREVWRITERRDGAVYKTEFVERRWVELGSQRGRPDDDPDLMFTAVSTSYEGQTTKWEVVRS